MLVLVLVLVSVSAFAPPSPPSTRRHASATSFTAEATTGAATPPSTINPSFGRAVECAETFGLCPVDEMADLAEQLEDFDECFYEDGVDACDKEMQDRKDVAGMLRMAAEMQLRMDYLKNANLFASDVHKEIDRLANKDAEKEESVAESWDDYKEQHGMGLGLW